MNTKSSTDMRIPAFAPMYDPRLNPGAILRRTHEFLPDNELGLIRADGCDFYGYRRDGQIFDSTGRPVTTNGPAEACRVKMVQVLRRTEGGGFAVDEHFPFAAGVPLGWACKLRHVGCGVSGETEVFEVESSDRFVSGTQIVCDARSEPDDGELGVMYLDVEPVLGTMRPDHFLAVSYKRLRYAECPSMPIWRVVDVLPPLPTT